MRIIVTFVVSCRGTQVQILLKFLNKVDFFRSADAYTA